MIKDRMRKCLCFISICSLILTGARTLYAANGSTSVFTAPQIAAGALHTAVLKSDGTVWAWGRNSEGQLGNNSTTGSEIPVQASGMTQVTAIAAGLEHTVALRNDGTVWAWGCNSYGQLGDNTTGTNRQTAVQVVVDEPTGMTPITEVTAIAAGMHYTVALKSDGTVWAWGWNDVGQLGNGTTTASNIPIQVIGLTEITAIAAGESHALALKSDGTVWAWGWNASGQLGDGTTISRNTAVKLSELTGVTAIAAGRLHTVALKSDGTVWSCGSNGVGQLGSEAVTDSKIMMKVSGLSDIKAITSGSNQTAVLKSDGTVWTWGWNSFGQLGDNSDIDRYTAVKAIGLEEVTTLSAGANHTIALKNDGTVWAWGNNGNGQLGDGSTISSKVAIQTKMPALNPPMQPVLQLEDVGDGYAALSWSADAGATNYEIYQSTTAGVYTLSSNVVIGSAYSAKVTGLANGTTYYFVVKASNDCGYTSSNEISAVPQVAAPGAAVLQLVAAGNGYADIQWGAVSGATSYEVYQSEQSGVYTTPVSITTGSVYNLNVTGLTNGTTYYLVVKAINPGGSSQSSNEVSVVPRTIPQAPQNVTAVAGNGEARISFTPPSDNGGSPITRYIVTARPGNRIALSDQTSIIVTGLTNGISYTFTVKASNAAGDSQGSASSNAVTPMSPASGGGNSGNSGNAGNTQSKSENTVKINETGVEVEVQGKPVIATTQIETILVNGETKTLTRVILDDAKLEGIFNKEDKIGQVNIFVKNDTDDVTVTLKGQTMQNMANKEMTLQIITHNIIYTLAASQMNMENMRDELGKQLEKSIELEDIEVNIRIIASPKETVKWAQDTANKNNYLIVVNPVEFEISCSSGGYTAEISKFNSYVERLIALPDGIDADKIITGVIMNTDKSFSHLPTSRVIIDGKHYVKIKSLTNSTYLVIDNPKAFKDIQAHWAKKDIEDMASRLISEGDRDNNFEPDRPITRAELAVTLVKALGLMRTGTGKDYFNDISKSSQYYDALSIAYEYDLIAGYENGNFEPMAPITREQAMSMLARAMKITGLQITLQDNEAEKLLLEYVDSNKAALWAKENIELCIKAELVAGKSGKRLAPKDKITKAELTVMIKRLLQKSHLI